MYLALRHGIWLPTTRWWRGGHQIAIVEAFAARQRTCSVFIAHDLDSDKTRLLCDGRISAVIHLDDGWYAVGADRLDGDRVADAVMAALSQCGQARLIAVAEMQVAPRTARYFANCSPMPLAPPVTTARPRRNWYGSSLLITSRSARNESTDRSRWLLAGVL